jgi:hypothetical protein
MAYIQNSSSFYLLSAPFSQFWLLLTNTQTLVC